MICLMKLCDNICDCFTNIMFLNGNTFQEYYVLSGIAFRKYELLIF